MLAQMGAEPSWTLWANLGGMGMMAAALFVLHRDAIKSFVEQLGKERGLFQEQLAIERKQNQEQGLADRAAGQELWKSYMDLKIRHHEQLLSMMVATDKSLEQKYQGILSVFGTVEKAHDRIIANQDKILDIVTPRRPADWGPPKPEGGKP